MFKILKKQIYRTQFIIYASLLFLACLLVSLGLLQSIFKRQVDSFHDDARQSFQNIEAVISTNIARIDSYFLDLYSSKNKGVLDDFMRLFGNDAETYITRRINEIPVNDYDTDTNCIEHISQFVGSTGNSISKITLTLFANSAESNIINFKTSTISTVEFKVNKEYLKKNSDGYIYTKIVMDPANMSKELGKMEFLIDKKTLYSAASNKPVIKSAFIGVDLAIMPQNASDDMVKMFQKIYKIGENSGIIGGSINERQQYVVFISELNQYRLVSAIPEIELIKTNSLFFIIVCGGMLFILVLCLLFILARMSYDAKKIQEIVKVIDQTKIGNFTTIDSSKMKDEYKIIAQELNDMAKQLDIYIKEKYIIKLKQEKAERKMLQQQISPHFLYNTLEIIRSRALVEGNEEIADVVCNLGNLFRSIVKGEDIITIEEELMLLQKYISIMEFKYPDRFFYQIDIPPEIRRMRTVKFWIQPIVENYFIHGFNILNEYNLLIIRASYVQNRVLFEFTNNGITIEAEKLKDLNNNLTSYEPELYNGKIGLRNVYTRLSYFYGDSLKMQVKNNDRAGVTVQIVFSEKQ